MIQQEMLDYQNLDGELMRIERELKKNEFFVKHKQFKALRQECEENIVKLDNKALELKNQLATAKQTMEKLASVIEEHLKEIADIEDEDELNYMSKKLSSQMSQLSQLESDIKRISREGEEIAKSFADLSSKLPKIISGLNASNAEFEKVANEAKPKVNEIKGKQQAIKSKIAPQLLAIYEKGFGQKFPVFVPLRDKNRCGGCQMDMPQAIVDDQLSKNGYVHCEHCGRIIYKED